MSESPLLSKHKSIREALQFVADNPEIRTPPIDTPAWELVGRILFEVANSPNPKVRGSMARATRAQKMIADRLVGKRRPGTHPATVRDQQVVFRDLTAGMVEEKP